MQPIQEICLNKVLLCDGAMGTELQKLGQTKCPEECNLSRPNLVQRIHYGYFCAGSDIVQTNSFGANRCRLEKYGLGGQVALINNIAVRLVKEVCPIGRFIAGSIGPTGKILEPFGDFSQRSAYDVFLEQAEALAEGGADILFIETMSAIEEAEAAIKAAKKTGLPIVATMAFKSGETGLRTIWGVKVSTAVQVLINLGADIIGANCGTPDDVVSVIEEMRSLTEKPLIAQPNASEPEFFKLEIARFLKAGINILGGCCGTNPCHVEIMRKLISAKNQS